MKLKSCEDINFCILNLEKDLFHSIKIESRANFLRKNVKIGNLNIILYILENKIKYNIEIRDFNLLILNLEEEPYINYKCFNVFENSINPFVSLDQMKEILVTLLKLEKLKVFI